MLYTNDAIQKRKFNENKTKKILNIVVYIILTPILVYNLILISKAVLNPQETPDFLGIKTYVIVSGSMKPELQIGDVVIVKKTEQNQLKVGDIISFREGQNVVTHRISEIVQDNDKIKYRTKGDNNNSTDEGLIDYKSIEGRVIKTIPYLGKVALALQGKITIIFIILVIYTYTIYSGKLKKRKMQRRLKRIEYEKRKWEEKYEPKN